MRGCILYYHARHHTAGSYNHCTQLEVVFMIAQFLQRPGQGPKPIIYLFMFSCPAYASNNKRHQKQTL